MKRNCSPLSFFRVCRRQHLALMLCARRTMIKTQNLLLIPCELKHFQAFLRNQQELAKILKITIPENWTEFPEVMQYAYDNLKINPALLG